MKATPVSGTVLPGGLATVIVSVDWLPTWMLAGVKALVMMGGAMTLSAALASLGLASVFPETTPVEFAVGTMLLTGPAVLLVTETVIWQLAPPASVAAEVWMRVSPAVLPAAIVPAQPPGVCVNAGVAATDRPDGKLSSSVTADIVSVGLGLAMVTVSVVVPPAAIEGAANDLVTTGPPRTRTSSVLLVAPLKFEPATGAPVAYVPPGVAVAPATGVVGSTKVTEAELLYRPGVAAPMSVVKVTETAPPPAGGVGVPGTSKVPKIRLEVPEKRSAPPGASPRWTAPRWARRSSSRTAASARR